MKWALQLNRFTAPHVEGTMEELGGGQQGERVEFSLCVDGTTHTEH